MTLSDELIHDTLEALAKQISELREEVKQISDRLDVIERERADLRKVVVEFDKAIGII